MKNLLILHFLLLSTFTFAQGLKHESFIPIPYSINNAAMQKQTPSDTIKNLPKVTLSWQIRNYSNMSGGMSAASEFVIKGYIIDDVNYQKFGFMRKNIKKQLSVDPIAMKYFNSHLVNYKISFFTTYISSGIFLTGMYYFTKQDKIPSAKTISRTLCFSGMGMLVGSYVFRKISDNKLRKSVKTYNKNAGYGYLDGLEFNDSKRKRLKDQKQN